MHTDDLCKGGAWLYVHRKANSAIALVNLERAHSVPTTPCRSQRMIQATIGEMSNIPMRGMIR